jgi:hypothetical protein
VLNLVQCQTETEFGASNFTAQKSKQLAREQSLLHTFNPRLTRVCSISNANHVKEFNNNNDLGKEDFVSVKENGVRLQTKIGNLIKQTDHSKKGILHEKHTEILFNINSTDEITHTMWLCTDRPTLKIMKSSTEEFLESFEAKLHSFYHIIFLQPNSQFFYKNRRKA